MRSNEILLYLKSLPNFYHLISFSTKKRDLSVNFDVSHHHKYNHNKVVLFHRRKKKFSALSVKKTKLQTPTDRYSLLPRRDAAFTI